MNNRKAKNPARPALERRESRGPPGLQQALWSVHIRSGFRVQNPLHRDLRVEKKSKQVRSESNGGGHQYV